MVPVQPLFPLAAAGAPGPAGTPKFLCPQPRAHVACCTLHVCVLPKNLLKTLDNRSPKPHSFKTSSPAPSTFVSSERPPALHPCSPTVQPRHHDPPNLHLSSFALLAPPTMWHGLRSAIAHREAAYPPQSSRLAPASSLEAPPNESQSEIMPVESSERPPAHFPRVDGSPSCSTVFGYDEYREEEEDVAKFPRV